MVRGGPRGRGPPKSGRRNAARGEVKRPVPRFFGGRGVDADVGADLFSCSEVLEQMLGMSAHSGNRVAADLQPQRRVVRSERQGGIFEWELRDGKKTTTIKTSGTTLLTDATHAIDLALAGVGITYTFEPLVRHTSARAG
jgi:hypothetical protein